MKSSGKKPIWKPLYFINPTIARALMEIEAAKTVVESTLVSPAVEAELLMKQAMDAGIAQQLTRQAATDINKAQKKKRRQIEKIRRASRRQRTRRKKK